MNLCVLLRWMTGRSALWFEVRNSELKYLKKLSWGGPGASLPSRCGGYPQGGLAEERHFCCCAKAWREIVCNL